jgi:threonine synthase
VPSAIGDYLMLRVLRDSGGTAVAVTDDEIVESQRRMAQLTGILPALEGAATYAALPHLVRSGFLNGEERVVLFNTGSGLAH